MVTSNRAKKLHLCLSILFTIIGIVVSFDLVHLTTQFNQNHTRLENQIKCNSELIAVLQKRSDARTKVDYATRDALGALAGLLSDIEEQGTNLSPDDPHVILAKEKSLEAMSARSQVELITPYPTCGGSH